MEHPDREGRPVVIMRPRNETSHNNETRIKVGARRLPPGAGTGAGAAP